MKTNARKERIKAARKRDFLKFLQSRQPTEGAQWFIPSSANIGAIARQYDEYVKTGGTKGG